MDKQNVVYPYNGILFYNNIVNNIVKYCKRKRNEVLLHALHEYSICKTVC